VRVLAEGHIHIGTVMKVTMAFGQTVRISVSIPGRGSAGGGSAGSDPVFRCSHFRGHLGTREFGVATVARRWIHSIHALASVATTIGASRALLP
jgi:hypothetical protein